MLIKLRTGEFVFLDDCCQTAVASLLDAATDRDTPANDVALEITADGLLSSDTGSVQTSVDALQAIIAAGLQDATKRVMGLMLGGQFHGVSDVTAGYIADILGCGKPHPAIARICADLRHSHADAVDAGLNRLLDMVYAGAIALSTPEGE